MAKDPSPMVMNEAGVMAFIYDSKHKGTQRAQGMASEKLQPW